jgi:type I restriction enzyme, S subunit
LTQEELIEVQGRWPTPASWKWYTLADITKDSRVELGDAHAQEKLISDIGTVPLILEQDLRDRKEIHATRYITQSAANILSKMIPGRALLVAAAREETMGRVGILDENQVAAMSHVIKVIYPNNQLINLDFLFHYFLLQQTRRYLTEELAPNSTSISPKVLARAKVVVPPLPEQKRLVERIELLTHDVEMCLDLLHKQRKNTLTIIALALRNTFSPSVISTWEGATQGKELFDLSDNLHRVQELLSEASPANNYPYIHAQTIEPFTGRLLDLKTVKASDLNAERSLNILEDAQNMIVYAPANNGSSQQSTNRACILSKDKMVCHSGLFALALRRQYGVHVLPAFLFWSLLADTLTLGEKRLGGMNIKKKHLLDASLPYPELNEQTRIVNHLNTLQHTVMKMREKQDEETQRLGQIKQTILEKAFRGML